MPPKMVPKLTCAHCKKKILEKHYLTCSYCGRSYDLTCTNAEKLYDLMDRERKASWCCVKCRQSKVSLRKASTPIIAKKCTTGATKKICNIKPKELPLSPPVTELQQELEVSVDNVTKRKYNVSVHNSFESLTDEDFDSALLRNDTLNRSCPDLSVNYKNEVETLKSKIAILQEKLELSDKYSTKLLIENENLSKQLSEYTRQINQLKDICTSAHKTKKPAKSLSKVQHQSSQTSMIKEDVISKIDVCAESSYVSADNEGFLTSSTELTQKITESCKNISKKIFILGGKQHRGLATALSKSRQNTLFEQYEVTSTIKPDARCQDILKSAETLHTSEDDVIIISIGENDCNPTALLAELSAFIKMRPKAFVIVTSVKTSLHLNENKLNNTVKLFCKSFDNCVFLDLVDLNYWDKNFRYKLCNKINFLLDSRHYASKYLSHNKLKLTLGKRSESDQMTNKLHKNKLIMYSTLDLVKKSSIDVDIQDIKVVKQKSITDFFPKASTSSTASQTGQKNTRFFRS